MPERQNRLRPAALARKLIKGVIGGVVVLAGIVMLITPGPGIVAILVGLGILATEFASARRILDKIRNWAPSSKRDIQQ